MLVALPTQKPERSRPLREEEKCLLASLLAPSVVAQDVDTILVEDMDDGGMGSIKFLSTSERNRLLGALLVEAEYIDEDGVLVNITINGDEKGQLYEMDFWKVSFSSLRRYPKPDQIKLKKWGEA